MLTPEEAFAFDLHGYIVIKGALDRERLLALSEKIGAFDNATPEQLPWSIPVWTPVINEYRILNVLDPVPDVLEYIDAEPIFSRLEGLMDVPFRMTEAYTITRGPGIGLYLHHLPAPIATYRVENGQPRSTYIKATIPLEDCNHEDGPFCVIEGSHKSGVSFPFNKLDPDWDAPTKDLAIVEMMEGHEDGRPKTDWATIPGFKELTCEVGDVILFTENLMHGARKNSSGKRRRGLYLGYGPASSANWHGVQYSPEILEQA
ncbi:MAG: phytanoyl-CoA dioxygenase family protein, partial [Planctomycetota bacterium]|nr:phytanoyl-CoA dioxygenase family protein [Planctomycetota bacterium]